MLEGLRSGRFAHSFYIPSFVYNDLFIVPRHSCTERVEMQFRPRSRPADRGVCGLSTVCQGFYFAAWNYEHMKPSNAPKEDVGDDTPPSLAQYDNVPLHQLLPGSSPYLCHSCQPVTTKHVYKELQENPKNRIKTRSKIGEEK